MTNTKSARAAVVLLAGAAVLSGCTGGPAGESGASPAPTAEATTASTAPSSSPSAAETQPPAPGSVFAPAQPFYDGSVPDSWNPDATVAGGTDVWCGKPLADVDLAGEEFRVEVAGTPAEVPDGEGWLLPVRITEALGTARDVHEAMEPQLVWAQGGRVVDLSEGTFEGGSDWRHDRAVDGVDAFAPGEGIGAEAHIDRSTRCGDTVVDQEEPWAEYVTPRAAGTYEVYAVVGYRLDPDAEMTFTLSEPVVLTVAADGTLS